MLSEITSRYYRALISVLKKEPKETLKNDIVKLSAAIHDPKFQDIICDPFRGIHSKIDHIKKLQINRYIQNCIEEMIKNNRFRNINELVHKLAADVKGEKSPITIWSYSVTLK